MTAPTDAYQDTSSTLITVLFDTVCGVQYEE